LKKKIIFLYKNATSPNNSLGCCHVASVPISAPHVRLSVENQMILNYRGKIYVFTFTWAIYRLIVYYKGYFKK